MPLVTSGLLQATTTITATATDIGDEINVSRYSTIALFIDYTKGDEDGVTITPYVLHTSGGNEYQYQTWDAAAGDKESAISRFYMTATGNYYFILDVTGIRYIKYKNDAVGGTPTGTIAVNYVITSESAS